MPNFWEAIPVDKRGRTYADLATYQWNVHRQILPRPVFDRIEVIINAPDYEQDSIEEINRELSTPPRSPGRPD